MAPFFGIFGSMGNLALKISHRNYFKWIPLTQISQDEKSGQIENGSIFRIFGSVSALALRISHRDYIKWIPRNQISLDAKFWSNPEWLHS